MKKSNVYVGTIMQKENENQSVYQRLNLFVKIKNDEYINLEWMESALDTVKLYKYLCGIGETPEFVLKTTPNSDGLYIDGESLDSYYDMEEKDDSITINKVKNDWLTDPRVPRGVDYISENKTVIYTRKLAPSKERKLV